MRTKSNSKSFPFGGFICALALAHTWFGSGDAMAAAAAKSSNDSPFVAQSQVTVSVIRAMRPSGVLQADIGIIVPNQSQRARAASLQPVLRDAWRRTTQEFANSQMPAGRAPDAVLLGQRLQAATDQIVGQGVARVLFTSLVVR
jgi:flagellar basal body-associated protein FliL